MRGASTRLTIDLDDTLYLTTAAWRQLLLSTVGRAAAIHFDRFGFALGDYPETLRENVREILRKNDVSADFYLGCRPIKAAQSAVQALQGGDIKPSAYVTARGYQVKEASLLALARDGYPKASIVCRPSSVAVRFKRGWKLDVLQRLFLSDDGWHVHIADQFLHKSSTKHWTDRDIPMVHIHWFRAGSLLAPESAEAVPWSRVPNLVSERWRANNAC